MIFYHNRTAFHFHSLHLLSLFTLIQKVIQKYLDITFNERICQFSEKKCSCITDHVCRFSVSCYLSLSLSSGSLFLDKDHTGDSQYWGLTVGGLTGARFTQRKVQIKLGQHVQGVQEFRCCQGDSSCQDGGLWWWSGEDEVVVILSLEEDRRHEGGGKYVTTTRGWCMASGKLGWEGVSLI